MPDKDVKEGNMGVLPVYLGWDEPLLTTAVSWLLEADSTRKLREDTERPGAESG